MHKIQENIEAEIMKTILEEAHESYRPEVIMVIKKLMFIIFPSPLRKSAVKGACSNNEKIFS